MEEEVLPSARIPSATYRLQFNARFTFRDARQIAGYLNELGISDLYASSYLAAKEGSLHGYDVVNQTILNKEVGDEQSYQAMVGELQRLGMGHILDFVPNHMCIESSENAWWMDVLENGESSPYARFFDIDWQPVKKELTGKVLLPFLGDQYGKVLEDGQLKLSFAEGAFRLDCSGVPIPLEPKSCLQLLGHRLEVLQGLFAAEAPPLQEFLSIITALQHLPGASEPEPEKREERHREKDVVKKRLGQLCQESPEIAGFIGENLAIFNGTKGDSASFDLLDRLLRDQVYRPSYWRVATEEINYRRFFDVNGLAAIRMEDPAVFEQTHQLLFRLIREGKVTGVRIDHVDGLFDPISYLQNLQKRAYLELSRGAAASCGAAGEEEKPGESESREKAYREALLQDPSYKPFYALCEKILMKGELLPEEWPVFGTTGYDFLGSLNGIFVDTEKAREFDRLYARFAGPLADFPEVAYEKKKLVMQVSLSGEVNMLAHRLNTISEQDRHTRDFTMNSLARVITEVIACFPVYRSYANCASLRDKDLQYIEAAVARAKRKNPAISASIFDFLRDVLLLKSPERAGEGERAAWLNFAMRFQQITGPVMAKGMEDTAFYVYNRLASLNEVGGMPGRFGTPLEAFHGQNMERIKSFPHSMITTDTHDSKRGEDVRTRIDALSELPELWQKSLAKWRRLNKGKSVVLENQTVPDRNEEYLLYQTLIGAWPALEPDQGGFEKFRGRIREYMVKAVREAKVNTSWISPNAAYEDALTAFVNRILFNAPGNAFLREFLPFQKRIARSAVYSSLSQALLKMVSPGVPDLYQGTELWDFTLVDPDNRQPVDYQRRVEALAGLRAREAEIGPGPLFGELQGAPGDGRVKLYLIYRVLNYRKRHRELFDAGDYLPLEARGAKARHLCAFARRLGGQSLLAVAPRLLASLSPDPELPPLGEPAWLDTFLVLPEGAGARFRNVLNDAQLEAVEVDGKWGIALAGLFESLPLALLEPA
jgi:(1->4)-alpha-D-glucan 1-alpha-D-glucosylmutase